MTIAEYLGTTGAGKRGSRKAARGATERRGAAHRCRYAAIARASARLVARLTGADGSRADSPGGLRAAISFRRRGFVSLR